MTLQKAVLSDDGIRKYLSQKEIEEAFDYNYHLKNVDKIFDRLGMPAAAKKVKRRTKVKV